MKWLATVPFDYPSEKTCDLAEEAQNNNVNGLVRLIQHLVGNQTEANELNSSFKIKKLVGVGSVGKVHEVIVSLGKKKQTLALKEYQYQEYAEESVRQWLKLRKTGMPTYRTYRMNSCRKKIFMSFGNRDGYVVDALVNSSLGRNHLIHSGVIGEGIQNFDDLLTQAQSIITIAQAQDVHFRIDSLLYHVSGSGEVTIFIGDCDSPKDQTSLPELSAEHCKSSLESFFDLYCGEEVADEYIRKLRTALS